MANVSVPVAQGPLVTAGSILARSTRLITLVLLTPPSCRSMLLLRKQTDA